MITSLTQLRGSVPFGEQKAPLQTASPSQLSTTDISLPELFETVWAWIPGQDLRTWCSMRAPTAAGESSPPSTSARAKAATPAASQRFADTAASTARSSFHFACSRRSKPSFIGGAVVLIRPQLMQCSATSTNLEQRRKPRIYMKWGAFLCNVAGTAATSVLMSPRDN